MNDFFVGFSLLSGLVGVVGWRKNILLFVPFSHSPWKYRESVNLWQFFYFSIFFICKVERACYIDSERWNDCKANKIKETAQKMAYPFHITPQIDHVQFAFVSFFISYSLCFVLSRPAIHMDFSYYSSIRWCVDSANKLPQQSNA